MTIPPTSIPSVPIASREARIAAGVGSVVAGVLCIYVTRGGALVAMCAVAIAWAIGRQRARPLTRMVSWFVAAGSVAVVLLGIAALVTTRLPPGAMAEVRRTMDSTAKAPPPQPPEWLKRITPPNAVQKTAIDGLVKSTAFTIWVGVVGAVLGIAFLASVAGTLGWIPIMLLLFAATGSWLPRKTTTA